MKFLKKLIRKIITIIKFKEIQIKVINFTKLDMILIIKIIMLDNNIKYLNHFLKIILFIKIKIKIFIELK